MISKKPWLVFMFATGISGFVGVACFPSSDKMSKQRAKTQADNIERELGEQRNKVGQSAEPPQNKLRERDEIVADARRRLDELEQKIDLLARRTVGGNASADLGLTREVEQLRRSHEALATDVDNLATSEAFVLGESRQSIRASIRELERTERELAARAGAG